MEPEHLFVYGTLRAGAATPEAATTAPEVLAVDADEDHWTITV
jgi:gamma-glutamylcyclotransferase (GGCT)/AIG2-like uncharacterized protein YtfP